MRISDSTTSLCMGYGTQVTDNDYCSLVVFFQIHWTSLKKSNHKASLSKGYSSLKNEWLQPLPKGDKKH